MLTHSFVAERDGYARLRGTDGKRSQPGHPGTDVDPAGAARGRYRCEVLTSRVQHS
jgi:hypothetical protein